MIIISEELQFLHTQLSEKSWPSPLSNSQVSFQLIGDFAVTGAPNIAAV